ncbi:hypothetical protein C0Q70_16925 [Pomacea canaliculata]|uniref:Delta-like protein n=1 Tax=Pomacea canaliculata TaxID=400727 RepID=A0A2T7NR75_POMCA|nr:hypothetical protein C0Q70_16925 [Pomacea canaliculata]
MSSDETPCDLLSVDTGAFELSGNGDVKFVSGRPNPVLFDLPTWTGSVFITLQILDLDTSASENVDKFSFWYSLQSPVRNRLAGPSDYTNHTLIGQRKVEPTSLSVSVNVMCDRFYYSDNCSVNCVSSDDCNGHYDCDTTTGERTCLQGWGGSACSVQLSTDHGCNKDQVCYHGSTCVPYDNKQFYYCCCAAGYTGINCETDVDECASQPCHNGGNCSQGDPGKYECQCPLRYKGRNCEESKTCADNPCLNNGNCSPIRVATTETFYCSCPPGFTGGLCESVITTTTIPTTTTTTPTTTSTPSTTTSLTSTMSTPAVCSEDLYGPELQRVLQGRNDCTGHYSCNRLTGLMECLPGWRGANCSSKTQPDPGCQCQNGGECFLDTCCCPDNFTGLLCQTPVSYCRAGRCLNGGTCYEEASGFQCACAAGFTGERCEKAVCPMDFFGPSCAVYCKEEDSCETGQYTCHPDTGARVCRFGWRGQQCSERDPAAQHEVACPNSECRNNGICANNTCCCRPGFTGSLCHIEILECASSPCQNGARCHDLIADYRCECRRGFAGKNCESRVEPTPSDVTSPVFDPCYGVTCFNKGTCVNNGTAESICLCLEGFSGKFCQDVVSHMTSTQNPLLPPCQKNYYGPDCTTFCKEEHSCDMGHYYCDPQSGAKICRNGWSGPQCLTRIVAHENDPECPKGIPCLNEGSCSNGTCCCRQGFSGTYCEVEELHCARSPCLNGRCQDLQNGYKCECNQGYDGIHCENFTEISNTTTVPSLATDANVKETIDVRSTPNTSPGIETNPGSKF